MEDGDFKSAVLAATIDPHLEAVQEGGYSKPMQNSRNCKSCSSSTSGTWEQSEMQSQHSLNACGGGKVLLASITTLTQTKTGTDWQRAR